jgi:hypothetical protein
VKWQNKSTETRFNIYYFNIVQYKSSVIHSYKGDTTKCIETVHSIIQLGFHILYRKQIHKTPYITYHTVYVVGRLKTARQKWSKHPQK